MVLGCGIEPPIHKGHEFYKLAPIPLGSPSMVDPTGVEPAISWVQTRRSPG